MKDNKKHEIPLLCRLKSEIILKSPSAMLCKCKLGIMRDTRRCCGCSANIREIFIENLSKGFDEGLKAGEKGFLVTTVDTEDSK